MKIGKIVWLSTHQNPFVISPSHCLDLDCPCTDVWLQMTEVNLDGHPLASPLSFEVQACLRTWIEREPPRRSPEIDALVREFLVEFPPEWVDELIEIRRGQRAAQRRFAEYKFESPRSELVCYSDIVSPDGGLASGGRHYGFFFAHAGRNYLVEDHYCPTPECDCQKVHFEFWERSELEKPRRIDVRQLLMASFTLDGELVEVHFCAEDSPAMDVLLEAWRSRAVELREELAKRYEQVKGIGQRSFPQQPQMRRETVTSSASIDKKPIVDAAISRRVGRNDACPCGSGRKFKRCCASMKHE
jgi:hypothetical protein